ncbi:hypothetical protein NQZ68_014984 [Dissostichus eleginoides]|nr:hypothetical protein NQZ68_014984 [Dissostichus eleginoides]
MQGSEVFESFKIHIKVSTEEFRVIGFGPPPLYGPGRLFSHEALPSCCSGASGPALRGDHCCSGSVVLLGLR